MMRMFLMFCLVFQVTFGHGFQEFTVSGGVARPARIVWLKGMTLAGAIEAAGGVTKEGNLNEVALVRNGKRYVYDLTREGHRGVRIYARDVIEVPEINLVEEGEGKVGIGPKLKAEQSIEISVAGIPDNEKGRLNATYSISKSGDITMWKVGKIKAAGKTKAALAKEIAVAYKKAGIYDEPVFQVLHHNGGDEDLGHLRFTIGGQVRSAGGKPWKKGMTLTDAVKSAGGAAPFADLKRVNLYRKGKIYKYDLTNAKDGLVKINRRDVIEVTEINIPPGSR